MPPSPELKLYSRKPLAEITRVPDDIISVYVVEQHIWENTGSEETRRMARRDRLAEPKTVAEFLIDPVRPFLMDFFRLLAAPYDPAHKDDPIGQGYWIQAEFGSGKSHLLSFIGALALGREREWELVRQKENKLGKGKRESLYTFYEDGLKKKSEQTRGLLVAVRTLVGQGGGGVGLSGADRSLTEYVLDAVAEQFYAENGRSLPLYPTEILAERFLKQDLERNSRDLARFLKDPKFFDEEKQETLEEFLEDLQNNPDPGVQRDCGQRLWDFYDSYLQSRPKIPIETEEVLKHMLERLLAEGYAGLVLILDEVSLFMKGRVDAQRVDDEKTLVVLSNRLAKVANLPVWTVCAAQQAIETKLVGIKNIIADERLKLVPLLNKVDAYYDIALARVREVTDPAAVEQYYEDYKRSFSWPAALGKDQFTRFFPFYPPAIDVVRAVSYNLTTVRSALYFMLQTLKTQRARRSNELITLWSLFEDVVSYEEDPSGTTRSIASVKTKFPEEWQAYEEAKRQIDGALSGPIKVYRSRCEKIVKTLFLYHVANLSPNGLSHEELMNCVMEWKDHDRDQAADLQDNRDHYEVLAGKLDIELVQVEKVSGGKYRFNRTGSGPNPLDLFQKARAEVGANEVLQKDAWQQLLKLNGWPVETGMMTLDLAGGVQSLFREIAPESQKDITLKYHGRELTGRVYMRDLLDVSRRAGLLPSINSTETGLDFAVFVSNTPLAGGAQALVKDKGDPRILFWTPDPLSPAESALLLDFAAYRTLVAEARGKDTEKAKLILGWVQGRLNAQMGTLYRIVPDSYGRGKISAADHAQLPFTCQGELSAILTPLVEQVLDATYACKDQVFNAQAPFNDVNAINVINGIVRAGEFPRGIKPGKEVSASQNYGFTLGILRRPNDHKLDLRDCRYTREMLEWIEDKLSAGGASMAAATLYKNFMGVGGPNGIHYGLSKRMVQLYLLCLVREGRIRITLSGRGLPADALDYTNIASIDFKTATLDGFDQIQRLKAPEGWEILAPFAAVLLNDEAVRAVRDDADIQSAVQRLLLYKREALEPCRKLRKTLEDLFKEWGLPFGASAHLAAWEGFLAGPVEIADPIPFLRAGLEKAFGYPIYHDESVRLEDVDDLAARRVELEQLQRFAGYREPLRAALRYLAVEIPDAPELADLKRSLDALRERLPQLDDWTQNETRLLNEFIQPMHEAAQTYAVRYLQALDRVVSRTEQVRQQLAEVGQRRSFYTLAALAQVKALGADPCPGLRTEASRLAAAPELFPAAVTRAAVERDLPDWPQPAGCPLTLGNSAAWLEQAERAAAAFEDSLNQALLGKAALLASPALHTRLEQGKDQRFIANLLAAASAPELIVRLVEGLTPAGPQATENLALLERCLKRVTVVRVRLADLLPERRTVERQNLDALLAGLRAELLRRLGPVAEDETQLIEFE